jgi:hypothetical protein
VLATISIDEIERDPPGCLWRVEAGATLLVLRDERSVAAIKPAPPPP